MGLRRGKEAQRLVVLESRLIAARGLRVVGGLAPANDPIFYNQPNPLSNGRPLLRCGYVARRGPRIKAQLFRARGGWRIIWGFIVGDARLGMGMHGNETEA